MGRKVTFLAKDLVKYIPIISQFSPVYPAAHKHLYESSTSIHSALCLHGLLAHITASDNRKG